MTAETLAAYGPWAVVAACFVAIATLASACLYLYRDGKAATEARVRTLMEVLPLVRDLLDFAERRARTGRTGG